MTVVYILLMMALLLQKAYKAWRRGRKTYVNDRAKHDSLREYLLGNGATRREAMRPFVRHAVERAFKPLLVQWRLLAVLTVFALLCGLLPGNLTVAMSLFLLVVMIAATLSGILLALLVFIRSDWNHTGSF